MGNSEPLNLSFRSHFRDLVGKIKWSIISFGLLSTCSQVESRHSFYTCQRNDLEELGQINSVVGSLVERNIITPSVIYIYIYDSHED